MPSLRVACAFGFAALLVACAPDASEETSSTESAVTVCAVDAGTLSQGIDVSHYSGTIDWTQVKAAGIDFAFAKATEGTTFVDPTFATNWDAMKSAGVIRGAYHFFHPELDPTDQANFVVATVGTLSATDFPIVLDMETNGGESESTVVANALTFLSVVEAATGRTPIIYTSNRVITTVSGSSPLFASYALWDAEYGVACPVIPAPWTTWSIWQTDGTGTVDGVPSGDTVDLDTFNGTLADLQTFISGASSDGGTIIDDDGGTTKPDGGSISPGNDSGSAIDDDASRGDTSPDASSSNSGCACTLGRESRSSSASWLTLAALALMVRRKNTRVTESSGSAR